MNDVVQKKKKKNVSYYAQLVRSREKAYGRAHVFPRTSASFDIEVNNQRCRRLRNLMENLASLPLL